MNTKMTKLTTFMCCSLFASTSAVFAAQLSSLPFYADDLKGGERWSTRDHAQTTTQKFGYDLGVKRYLSKTKTWSSIKIDSKTHWKNPKNANYLIYGKPVYAMADGEVFRCWRNAPENPRPKLKGEKGTELKDKLWLHKEYRNRRMPGGGNELFIRHNDGSEGLYAHMMPGEIPKKLCPHNKPLFDKPGNKTEADVPVGKRVRVKKGQFLGLVGNSGNSTNPHLHIHVQKNGKGVKIVFDRGLATNNEGNKGDINKWTRFAGKAIPKGPVLIWPPRKLSAEYARHKYPVKSFKRLFDHLSDSGYALDYLDGYSVGGKPFFNFVWRPAKPAWRAYFGQTASNYQKRVTKAKADGFAATQVESYLANGQIRYAGIFKKTSGAWRARHGLTTSQHQQVFEKAKADGFRPINVSVVSKNGKLQYTVLYRKTSLGAWSLKSKLNESAYQKAVNDNEKAGKKPFYISAYMHNGKPHFSAIFAQNPKGSWRARHGLTTDGYQSQWNKALKDGLLTRVVTGYDGAKTNHRYAAMWRK